MNIKLSDNRVGTQEDNFQNTDEKHPRFYDQKEPVIRTLNEIDVSGTYSYANYLRWEISERLELVKGKIFPIKSPSTLHQRCTGRIFVVLALFLKHKRCEVFVAPFDVRFPYQSKDDVDITTVLQPDICVVCERSKIDKRGCSGAPDIVVEVLSSGDSKTELDNKYRIYEEFGVREYWIVQPSERSVFKYILTDEGVFSAGRPYTPGQMLASDVLPGFQLNIAELFFDAEEEE